MRLSRFTSYEDYIKAQKRTVRKRRRGPFFTWHEILQLSKYLERARIQPQRAVCHGARDGLECFEFLKHFPKADIFGTDLLPYQGRPNAKRKAEVVCWDFNQQNKDWLGAFDFIYTNSFDHVVDPIVTLDVWLAQLKPAGRLFIQWNAGSAVATYQGGDCFGASFWDMARLLDTQAKLVDLIYVRLPRINHHLQKRGLETVVFIVKPGELHEEPA